MTMNGRNGNRFNRDMFGDSVPTDSSHCLKDYLLEQPPNALEKTRNDLHFNNASVGSYITPQHFINNNNLHAHSNNIMPTTHHNVLPLSFPDIHLMPNYSIPDCGLPMPNQQSVNFAGSNMSNEDFSLISSMFSLPELLSNPMLSEITNPSVMQHSSMINNDNSSLLLCDNSLESPGCANILGLHERSHTGASLGPEVGYNDVIASTGSYISSPVFGLDAGIQQSKADSDPFSPSISSNVSSVPSMELSEKTSFIPGSVDSGVVVNGSISSPFSVPESNKNGECGGMNDSLIISPTVQRTGSERSVNTTPRSESISSEMCSPQVDLESLVLAEPTTNLSSTQITFLPAENDHNKPKERSHKSRKRKNETKKEKKLKKHQPVVVPTYQSQISSGINGIKLKISLKAPGPLPASGTGKRKKHKKSLVPNFQEPDEQTPWGEHMPEEVLRHIFTFVSEAEGTVPFLIRASNVCKLWRRVAIDPSLWHTVDLSGKLCSADPRVNDHNFRWLCENRLSRVQDLNLGGWKFASIPGVISRICSTCSELEAIGLMGWEGFNMDNLEYLIANCPKLQKLDLSGVYSNQCGAAKSAVSIHSLLNVAEEMSERLTQLILSDNRLSGIPQIINALSTHCANLQLLDLSNVRTTQSCGLLHIEKLQEGCQNLRILRITNSQLSLLPVTLKEQMTSPGFPNLEELSVACVTNSLSSMTQPFVDDNAIERILKTSQKLKLLDARGCTRVTDSSLVRIPAWNLTHLYLSGSFVTRTADSGLELIAQKWSHSLLEVDLSWSSATRTVDAAVNALAEQGANSPLKILDLTGSSVSLEPVKEVLLRCDQLCSLNLTSCRGLPRGVKRLYTGETLKELKKSFQDPSTPVIGGSCTTATMINDDVPTDNNQKP